MTTLYKVIAMENSTASSGTAIANLVSSTAEGQSSESPLIQKDNDLIRRHPKGWVLVCLLFEIAFTSLLASYAYAIGSFITTFDEKEKMLYFFSNVSILLQLSMVVATTWYCNLNMCMVYIKKCFKTWLLGGWDNAGGALTHHRHFHSFSFHGLYRRLNCSKENQSSFWTRAGSFKFLLHFVWPILNVGVVCHVFREVDKPMADFYDCEAGLVKSKLYRSIEIAAFFYYGFFTGSIDLVRQSFLHQMTELARNSPNKSVEEIKSNITKIWLQIQDYRSVVGWWLCFATSIGITGLAVQWNWAFDDQIDKITEEIEIRAAEIYRFWMWSESLMLFLQPLLAAGSYDVDYVWDDFKNEFMKYLDTPKHQKKLTAILRHTKHVYSEGGWMKPAIGLTILAMFMSFNLPQQFIWFWVRPGCVHPTSAAKQHSF